MASLSSLFWYAHKNLEDQMILFRFCLSIISSTLINFVKLHFLDPACVHGHSGSGNAYADFLSRASYSPRGSASTRGAPWPYHKQFKVVVDIVMIHILPRWSSWRCTSASPGRPGPVSLDVLSYRWMGSITDGDIVDMLMMGYARFINPVDQ